MSKKLPEERFWDNIASFCDMFHGILAVANEEGKCNIPPNIADIAKAYLAAKPKKSVIEGFISRSITYWPNIQEKSEDFFQDKCTVVFADLPEDQVAAFRNFITAKNEKGERVLSAEQQQDIWDYFLAFVKISIHYMHEYCGPRITTGEDGKKKRVYSKAYMANGERILVMQQASKYGANIIWPE